MKWVTDNTGRFRLRPHYQPGEIDEICEDAITSFLIERHGAARYPVTTEDLTVLIEQSVEDFDSSCDLDDGVDGFTDFFPGRKPEVKIARRLQPSYLENRLRTTLTHEFGHVRLHGFLFAFDDGLKKLFDGKPREHHNRCHRDDIEGRNRDWMEWQAAYASGALLMPASALTRLVRAYRERSSIPYADIGVDTLEGAALIAEVMREFQVSQEAARVRLSKRSVLVENPAASLF